MKFQQDRISSHQTKLELIFAYYCFLTKSEFRRKFIECGSKLLDSGTESENIYLLVGAENDSRDELIKLFKLVASEVEIDIPKVEQENLWLAESSIDLIRKGYNLPDYQIDTQLKRYILIFYEKFTSLAVVDATLSKFNFQLGKFIEKTGHINDFEEWLKLFRDLSETIQTNEYKLISTKIVNFIMGFSYGGFDNSHLRYCDSILEDFESL